MSTATYIKNLSGWAGSAALYQLDPPLEGHGFVAVSSVDNNWAQETYIFPASSSGEVSDFGELPGSIRGDYTHADALREAGYEIKP